MLVGGVRTQTLPRPEVTCVPVTFSSSLRAEAVLRTRMVTIPMSRAGFRLLPKSSRKTTWTQTVWRSARGNILCEENLRISEKEQDWGQLYGEEMKNVDAQGSGILW